MDAIRQYAAEQGIPAIVGIVAKIMNLIEELLDNWVTVSWSGVDLSDYGVPIISCGGLPNNECFPGGINCTVTECGRFLVDYIADGIEQLSALMSNLLQALGSIPTD